LGKWQIVNPQQLRSRLITEEELRRRIQLQLNRSESRRGLARRLFFANGGGFRSGDYEEIMNKASCLSLLSNVVLAWTPWPS
jgi:TnpA family transposase